MLAVQVQYWDMRERMRHNKVAERQNDRSLNLQEEGLEETKRHNVAVESYNSSALAETARHNLATESLTEQSNYISMYRAESDRMNALTNMRNAATNAAMIPIQWYNAESTRMNVENTQWYNEQRADIERDRNNISRFQSVTGASVGYSQAATASQNADTNYLNAQTNQGNLEVNKERNQITKDYNQAIIQYNYDYMERQSLEKQRDRILERQKVVTNTIKDFMITGWRTMYNAIKESEGN